MPNYTLQEFATRVLKGIGAPTTPENVRALVGWAKAEGGDFNNDSRFNPLNTTQPAPGAGNTGSQGNIKVYRNLDQGVQATVQTLRNGRYAPILHAFAQGNSANAVADAIGRTPWGTNAAFVRKVIGSTPAQHASSSLGSSVDAFAQKSKATPAVTTSTTVPDETARRQAVAQFLLTRHQDPNALLTAVSSLKDATKTETTTTMGAPRAPSAPSAGATGPVATGSKGTAAFEGHKVAAWIAPALEYAREHGWKGQINSGFRTFADQTRIYNSGVRPAAKPGTSNHEGSDFPRGAVDVSDAAQLSRILQGSKYRSLLVWAGAKDPVHFSHPHAGSY